MARVIMIFIFFNFVLCYNVCSQTKEYKLFDKTFLADINYNAINALDTFGSGMELLNEVFKPTQGNYIVYRFLAEFKGLSFTDQEKAFHDILIVKTDKNNKILDAYQYTLEWAELPLEMDLYKSSCISLYLKNKLTIDKFKFIQPFNYDKNNLLLNDSGIVLLK